jgi:hypothetical protein
MVVRDILSLPWSRDGDHGGVIALRFRTVPLAWDIAVQQKRR